MNSKKYPNESAGGKMIKAVPIAYSEQRILDVKNMLFEKMKKLETINYIYVVNKKEELIGVFSVKEIFRSPEQTKVREIMKQDIIKVRPYTDQEKIAILALKNNLKSIPVVDKNNKFLGVVPSDIILDVLYSENIEDFLKLAGIHSPLQKILKGSTLYLTKVRLPWLIFGLLGGIFAAWIIAFFEESLRTNFILAAFIPLILYIASAVGTQTETLFIRNLILDSRLVITKYLLREIKTGFLMALILGVLLSLISVFWFSSPYYIGIILGISLFLTILMAILIGIFTPWLLGKLKKDPAIGTGPFATILRDVLSLVIYFAVIFLLLNLF
ncbi:magnesium transporter [Patescibacteria group bacterium]|nr:magnesium transporter [Patescibacteria group bacterium]MBU2635375.1 magnesium transporter [Patescibacteria group bacterium]